MNYRKLRILLITLLFPVFCSGQSPDTISVLFVGNSFTFFWNLPQMVAAMAEDQGVPIMTRQSTIGGSRWHQHWAGERGLKTKEIIANGDFDYIALQNYSNSAIEDKENFMEHGQKFAEFIRSHGAEPLLYMTWAYKSNPAMQKGLTAGYEQLAKKINAEYVPVGPLYAQARTERPDMELFFDDKHQSMAGTYLIALAFYKKLSGASVLEIPDRIITTDRFGEKLYLSIMNKDDAKYLRELVEGFQF
ncbi:MAG: hypothetical protein KJP00_10375 [Bacteroidia bacterium]|nr:hypothetical protein [Bacteroidia bacterium]